MIDIDFIKQQLFEQQTDRTITENDYITYDIVQLLRSGPYSKRFSCFKKVNSTRANYKVQLKCIQCGQLYDTMVSKHKLFEFIHKPYNCKCSNCVEIETKLKKENNLKTKQSQQLKMEEYTNSYIELYLNPDNSFKKDVPINERIDSIMNRYGLLDDKVADYIKSMDYHDFLQTPYWNSISLYMKRKAKFRCSLCGDNTNLNTHHKNYDNHGYEHIKNIANDMLIVLCQDCHEKFHDII